MRTVTSKDGTTIALPDKIKKLAVYEAPYNWPGFKDYDKKLSELVVADRKSDALAAFMMFLGMPADQLDEVRQLPMWPMWESVHKVKRVGNLPAE